jgi:conjugal transfer/type IV secretion protein DotA/TraY
MQRLLRSYVSVFTTLVVTGFLGTPAFAEVPDGWNRAGYANPKFGADFSTSQKRAMSPESGRLLVRAMYELETNQDSGILNQFIGLPRTQMVQARLHLEHQLNTNDSLSEAVKNRLLFQFDRTVGATAVGVLGDTFTIDDTAIDIQSMSLADQNYLVALNKGDVKAAADLRTEIIGSRVLELTADGFTYDEALNFSNTEFALTTDFIASSASIPTQTLGETVLLSLSQQGIPAGDATKLTVGLVGLSTDAEGLGEALTQSNSRFDLPEFEGVIDGYGVSPLKTGGSGGLKGWMKKLSDHWAEMRESNMVVSSIISSESVASVDEEASEVEMEADAKDKLSPLERVTLRQIQEMERVSATATNEKYLNLGEFSEVEDEAPVEAVSANDGYADWAERIQLEETDLIYATLARWLGGIFVEIREAYTANGKFNESFTSSGLSNPGTPTASYYSLTIITYIVIVIATYLASIYFVYGLYKGAEEGTFFGRQHDTSMTLGRMVISLAGNVPIPNLLGLTPVQVFLIVSMLFSLAIAGAAASFLTEKMVTMPMVTPIEKRNTSFVSSILKSQICMAAIANNGMLRKSEESDAYFKSTYNYNGVITKESYNPEIDESLLGKLRAWLSGTDKYKEMISMDEIRHVYEDLSLNKSTDKLARYRFGAEGRCGTFYVREGLLAKPIQIEDENPNKNRGVGSGGVAESLAKVDFNNEYVSSWINKVNNSRDKAIALAIVDLIRDLGVLAKSAVVAESDNDGGLSLAKEVLRGAYPIENNYYEKIRGELTKILETNPNPSDEAIASAVRRLGMGSLGAIYWFIEHKQQQITKFYDFSVKTGGASSMSTLASNDDGKASSFFNPSSFDVQSQIALLHGLVDEIIGDPGIVRAKRIINAAAVNNSIAEPGDADLLTNWLIQDDWAADADNFNVSPIERVRHFGNSVQVGMFAAGASLNALESFVAGMKDEVNDEDSWLGSLPGMKFALGFFSNLLKRSIDMIASVANPLFLAAFIASNVIPAMPFIMFTAAVVGLLVRYYSMLVAAPVWWMQKMHLGGGDLTGHSSVGWSLYFQMMLHAPLIVIGFIGGMSLNWVAGHFVNITFMPSQALQAMGGFNPTMYIGQVMVYSGLQVWVCYKSFSLTWEIPSIINSIIGQQFGAPGADENEGRQSIAAIVGQGTGGVGGALLTPGGGKPVDNPKANKETSEKDVTDEPDQPSSSNAGKDPKTDSPVDSKSSGNLPAVAGSQPGSSMNSGKDSGAGGNAGTSGGADKGRESAGKDAD